MKMTVNARDMKRVFAEIDRDYYSMNGIDALLEYYDEIDENMEFDPIAIRCDCTEYGDHGAVCSLADLINDYGYVYTVEDWMQDTGAEVYQDSDYLIALTEVLEHYTTVLHVCNGNYIVFAFREMDSDVILSCCNRW